MVFADAVPGVCRVRRVTGWLRCHERSRCIWVQQRTADLGDGVNRDLAQVGERRYGMVAARSNLLSRAGLGGAGGQRARIWHEAEGGKGGGRHATATGLLHLPCTCSNDWDGSSS